MNVRGDTELVSGSGTHGRECVSARAVLLDAAGTLIRPREPVSGTYAALARRCGVELEVRKLAQAFETVFGDMPDLAFEWTSIDELHCLERAWWRLLVRRVVAGAGNFTGDFDSFFAALYEHYAQGHAWECYPEVPDVLAGLHARDYRLAVVSNFDSRLPGILRAVGIYGYMDAVVYSSRAGSAKPDPAIFRQALDVLGIAPEHAVHVGDNPKADVGGALAAGLAALLIRRGHAPAVGSGQAISSLDELFIRLESSGGTM
ncbi:MAG: HAD-IA family hydrolase [Gammaproteobacteria bacterium]